MSPCQATYVRTYVYISEIVISSSLIRVNLYYATLVPRESIPFLSYDRLACLPLLVAEEYVPRLAMGYRGNGQLTG